MAISKIKRMRRDTAAEQAQLERMVSTRYAQGASQAEIAEELNVTQQHISQVLKKVLDKWTLSNIADIDKIKREELNKLNFLELEYMQAWERSKLNAEKSITKAESSNPTKPEKYTKQKVSEGQCGDPRYLEGVERVIKRRCEIIGIDAAKKADINIKYEKMTHEELAAEVIRKLGNTSEE